MEAFVGMQVLPANHRDTDYKEKRDYHESVTTGQTRDKVIHMCRYALQEPKMWSLFAI